mgnify:CR=1 FL=1
MNTTIDFEQYKKEALANKAAAKEALRIKENARQVKKKSKGGASVSKKGSQVAVGSPFPNVATKFDYKRLNIKLLEETAHAAPVARSLWQLQLIAFPWCDFTIIPPESEEEQVDADATKKIQSKIEALDRKVKTAILSAQAMYDVMTYGSAIFEIVWGTDDDGWTIPTAVQRLPAASFRISPAHVTGNTNRYVVGNLLKGIIFDKKPVDADGNPKETGEMQYWQVQDSSGLSVTPVQIPTENIIHIKDARSSFVDGEPYLAGITASISQWEFIRKRFMQTISRVGTPPVKITVGVPQRYLGNDPNAAQQISALPGSSETLADDMMTQLWTYAEALAQNVSADMATVVPEGINYDWQRPTVPINPTDPDQYIIREIIGHIFPRDVLDVLGSAISTSSQPLLDLLKLMVQGWQALCSVPFETELWTKFLEYNGFEGYRIELEWAPLVSPDKQKDVSMALQKFNLHLITLKEARSEVGLETSEEDEAKLKEEYTFYRTGGQQQGGPGGPQDPMAAMFGGGGGQEASAEEDPYAGMFEGEEPETQPNPDEASSLISEGEDLLSQMSQNEASTEDLQVKLNALFNRKYSENLTWLFED